MVGWPRAVRATAAVVVVATLVGVGAQEGAGALGLVAPLAPLDSHQAGGLALVAARIAVLALALDPGQRRSPWAVWVGGLFLLSLVVSAALLVLVGAGLLLVGRPERRLPRERRGRGVVEALRETGFGDALALAVASVGLLLAATRLGGPPPPELPPNGLPEAVAWYADRGNLFRARATAQRWCAAERVAATGCLVQAHASLALGQREEARALVRRIVAESPEPDLRARAAALLEPAGSAAEAP
jgi:hypothetical protein